MKFNRTNKLKRTLIQLGSTALLAAASVSTISLAHASPSQGAKNTKQSKSYSYVVRGQRYEVLSSANGYSRVGIASTYNVKSNFGKLTASGKPLDNNALTAANKELPLGTKVRVTNLQNNKSIVVTITDRGPFIAGRIIDLSTAAAKQLSFINAGTTTVKVQTV